MNLITRLLRPSQMLLDLDVTSKKRVFEQVGLMFENSHQIPRSVVFASLFNREKLGSTGLGHGLAIPHGRIKGLREPLCAFVRTLTPIAFDAPDGKPVSLIIVMLVPDHATEQHLALLSEIAQMLGDPRLRESLATCKDAEVAYRLMADWSPYAPSQRTAAL